MTSWQRNQLALQWHLQNDDIADFLQWSTIQATMFVGNAPYIEHEYDCLLGCSKHQALTEAIKENWIGNPTPFNDYTSGNLIHQAYHLKQWLDRTRQKLTRMDNIVEFGAGYGAMALLCRRLGFMGQYYIIDLPELVTVQQYYLGQNGVMAIWEKLPKSCDLFIASHSLSEVDIPTRERLLSQVAAREYLFASSFEFEGVDNQGYFERLAGGITGKDWVFYPHKFYPDAFYMVGVEL